MVFNYIPTDTNIAKVKAMYDGAKQGTMQVQYIAGALETYVTFDFNVLSFSLSTPVDGVRTATCSIGIIGKVAISHKA